MFAVGHAAYGYILAKATGKAVKTDIHIPLVLALSIAPDLDLLVRGLDHRGATHSIIVLALLLAPFLAKYRARALPYLVALTQHAFLGDYLTGGSELLWPVTSNTIGLNWSVTGLQNQILEWTGFILLILVLVLSRDHSRLLKPNMENLLLIIPAAATFIPLYIPRRYNLVPSSLLVPSIVLLILYALSMLSLPAYAIKRLVHKAPEPRLSHPGDKAHQ
jgi:membrane-bound metal-dependent hydrolase YbcI (DUF457 family)